MLWIITKGTLDLQKRFKELTGKDAKPEDKAFNTVEECFRSSISVHLLYCNWSTEDWRWYIKWLGRVVKDEVSIKKVNIGIELADAVIERYDNSGPSRQRPRLQEISATEYSGLAARCNFDR